MQTINTINSTYGGFLVNANGFCRFMMVKCCIIWSQPRQSGENMCQTAIQLIMGCCSFRIRVCVKPPVVGLEILEIHPQDPHTQTEINIVAVLFING